MRDFDVDELKDCHSALLLLPLSLSYFFNCGKSVKDCLSETLWKTQRRVS